MASLAFPSLRRTNTEMADDELYHLPNNSSLQFSFDLASVNNNNNNNNNAMAVAPPSMNTVSIPPQFDDFLQYQHMNNNNNTTTINNNTNNNNGGNVITAEQLLNTKSPFSDYANPDSQFGFGVPISNNFANNTSTAFNTFNNNFNNGNRHRFTVLDPHNPNDKPLRDEDYYLFNTDIQPSHLGSKTENTVLPQDEFMTLDSPLYVPPQQTEQYPIPGYENDYLMMSGVEDFEEDFEDPISDDDDEDNYFHDDFEEMMDDNSMGTNDFLDEYFKAQVPVQSQYNPTQDIQQMENQMQQMQMHQQQQELGYNNGPVQQQRQQQIIPPQELFASQASTASSEHLSYDLFSSHQSSLPGSIEGTNEQDVSSADEDDEDSFSHKHSGSATTMNRFGASSAESNPNHQCDLINPITKEPCNKQFSRSYDLIRHQETIHASKKKIFRCVICEGRLNGGVGNGKQKTFSRGDALSRHIKVKHGLLGNEAVELINQAKANVEFVDV